MILRNCTACSIKLTIVWVVHISSSCFIKIIGSVQRQLQAFDRSNVNKTVTSCSITFIVSSVQTNVLNRVRIRDKRTRETTIETVTVVHHADTVTVNLDTTICITDISRIDRSHLLSKCPDITRRRA